MDESQAIRRDPIEVKVRANLETLGETARPCKCRRRKTGPNPRRHPKDLMMRADAASKCPVHATTPFKAVQE